MAERPLNSWELASAPSHGPLPVRFRRTNPGRKAAEGI